MLPARLRPSPRATVWIVAVVTILARYPGLIWPLRPDEAGFLLVARNWDPQPDSMFGTYWVDRPPLIIAVVKAADAIGGPYFLRTVAVAGCFVLVLLVADVTRRLAAYGGWSGERVAVWAAVLTGALVTNPMFDSVSAKGEVLGIPVVVASCWTALVALERRSLAWSAASGLLAVTAMGLKQSLVGGLAFGGVLLLGALSTRRLDGLTFTRLAGAALVGASVPVLATVVWAIAAGVDLGTVWYAVVEFRADASRVLAANTSDANEVRAATLLDIALWCGIAATLVWFVLNLPRALRRLPVPTLAVLAMLVADVAGVALGGSYWRPYLIQVIPSVALALAITLVMDERRREVSRGRWPGWVRLVAPLVALSAVLHTAMSLVEWTVSAATEDVPGEFYTGESIRKSSHPGDTMVVYGGRADIQWAARMQSPYEHLWSLPMRTLDPDLDQLESVLTGPDAPTWVVTWVPLDSWDLPGHKVERALDERYLLAGKGCGSEGIYRLVEADRPPLITTCEEPFLRMVGNPW